MNTWLTCGYMAHKGLEGGYIVRAKDESGRQRDWCTGGGEAEVGVGGKLPGITRSASPCCRVCAFTGPDLIGWTPSRGA